VKVDMLDLLMSQLAIILKNVKVSASDSFCNLFGNWQNVLEVFIGNIG
jgi:hypothetical protein